MESQKKHLIKDNHGVALTLVMFLIFIMTFLGGSMYAFTMQSLKTLEYGTARQKAEYIARSGIEASVFLYQDAMLKGDDTNVGIRDFIKTTDAADKEIYTNWVYLMADQTYVDGGYESEATDPNVPKKENAPTEPYIGYFRVKITNGFKEAIMKDSNGKDVKFNQQIKNFESKGYCKKHRVTKKAYIVPLVDVNSKGWINPNTGVLELDKKYDPNQKNDPTAMILKTDISMSCGWIDQITETIKGVFDKGTTTKREINLPVYMGATGGNMVINAPTNKKTKSSETMPIRFADEKKDHAAGFLSLGNLFINGDIDIESQKTRFNMLMLRGNQIVIQGDINLYVYDPQINYKNGFTSLISGIAAKIKRNYRFSTVIIGTPSTKGTTITDPCPLTQGGLGACGQIFFGGNVYVNFITRGGQTRKYTAFRAGETYYFNGDYKIQIDKSKPDEKAPYGVDLLKYFLDTEITKHRHSSEVIQQFERTRNFYYNSTSEIYNNDKKTLTNPEGPTMRKIEISKTNRYDKVTDIVLPSPGGGSYIIWE